MIFLIEDSSKARFGGGQKISLEVIKVLSETEKVVLCDATRYDTLRQRAEPFIDDFVGLHYYGKIRSKKPGWGIDVTEIVFFPFIVLSNIFTLIYYLKITKYKTLTIYAVTKKALLYGFILRKLFKAKLVFHAHLIESETMVSRLLDYLCRQCDLVICVSEPVSDALNLPNSIVIHNPVDVPDHFMLKPMEPVFRVASFSSLIRIKGIEYFMQSFTWLKCDIPIEYVIYGTGEYESVLLDFTNENVILKGYAEEPLKKLQHIHLVVYPSVIAESFGMVILEAFSLGIPVITTDLGYQGILVKNGINGYKVPINDPQAIAQKIDFIIQHKDLYEDLCKNAYMTSIQYDVKQFREKMHRVFQNFSKP